MTRTETEARIREANPLYHTIAVETKQDIEEHFPHVRVEISGYQARGGTYYPMLELAVATDQEKWTDPAYRDMGRVYIDQDGFHFHGLTDYMTNAILPVTTVLLESPQMEREICEAVWDLIAKARHHRLMRAMLVTPAEQAGVGPGLDDD